MDGGTNEDPKDAPARRRARPRSAFSFFALAASCSMGVGCTAILGFDKDVESADAPLQPQENGDGSTTPSTPKPDAQTEDADFDATFPEDDAGVVQVPSYLDPTFGGAGTGLILAPAPKPGFGTERATCAAVTADDGVLWAACGVGTRSQGVSHLYRVTAEGKLDPMLPGIELKTQRLYALQPRGTKVLAIGFDGFAPVGAVWQYTATGELDKSFGTNGRFARAIAPQVYSRWEGAVMEGPNVLRLWGDRFAAGSSAYTPYTATLDLTTNVLGPYVTTETMVPVGTDFPVLTTLAMMSPAPDVLQFFGQYGPYGSGTPQSLGVARVRSGAPDTGFGNNGLLTLPLGANQTRVPAATVSAGKMVMGIAYYDYGSTQLVRLTADGAIDTSFGSAGYARVVPPAGLAPLATDVLVRVLYPLPDGSLLVGGHLLTRMNNYAEGTGRMFIARFTADGTPDASFGTGGFVSPKIQATPTDEEVLAFTRQADGHVVALGISELPSSQYQAFMMRLKP